MHKREEAKSTTKTKESSNSEKNHTVEYFETASFFWYLLIVPSTIYVALLAYAPDLLRFEYLGPIGTLSRFLHVHHPLIPILIFWSLVGAHTLEAIYAVRKANQMNINVSCRNKWFFHTLLLGFPSLRLIIRYSRRQQHHVNSAGGGGSGGRKYY